MLRPEVALSYQERERAILYFLGRYAPGALADMRVLEVGCGSGGNLLELIRLGFDPEKLMANELLAERAALARRNLPAITPVLEGDAVELRLAPAIFDIVYVSLVFSSLLDDAYQERLATNIWRWLKPGGGVLWYDFVFNNPSNPDVRGVPARRIRRLFPEARISLKRVTLAPPIARRVVRVHPYLCSILGSVRALRSHVVCWIGKS